MTKIFTQVTTGKNEADSCGKEAMWLVEMGRSRSIASAAVALGRYVLQHLMGLSAGGVGVFGVRENRRVTGSFLDPRETSICQGVWLVTNLIFLNMMHLATA